MNAKKLIMNALQTLLKTNSIDNITIDMLLKEAEVSRSTFYRHYRDKYDLMISFYGSFIEPSIALSDLSVHVENLAQSLGFIEKNKEYFRKINRVKGDDSLEMFIYNSTAEYYLGVYRNVLGITQPGPRELVHIRMISYASAKAAVSWIDAGCDVEARKMAEYMSEMVPPEIRKLIEAE